LSVVSGRGGESRRRAEGLYAARLVESGEVDLADLCREHADLAEELRQVDGDWKRASGIYVALEGRGGSWSPPAGSIAARGPDSMASAVLRRLELHAPRRSRFEIVEEVARGGMGAILKVWDPDIRRSLAMKVLLERSGEEPARAATVDEKPLTRFLDEAQITGQLDHPGVVPVHELGLDPEGRVFFTMQLVRGQDLESVLRLVRDGEEGWTLTRAVQVVQRICETMAYAHEKKVIHRDLKPANVMVGRFGEVYVMDWGLARVLGREDGRDIRIRPSVGDLHTVTQIRTDRDSERKKGASPLRTMDGDVLGTPAYMSPEQARGELEQVDQRSDVYSLGAMLYHLLAGHPPYCPPDAELNGFAVWGLVQAGPPEPLSTRGRSAPAELVAVCEKAMARDRSERYDSMQAMGSDLQAFLEGRVVRAYETGAAAELRKWIRRNRGTALASAAAILLALGGLGAVSFVQARSNADLARKNDALARATEAYRAARDEADRVVDFLSGLFESSDPSLARGELVSAKELLDRGARTIAQEVDVAPLVRARMMREMGNAYRSLGLYPAAEPLLQGALDIRSDELGPESAESLESLADLGVLRRWQGRYDEAEPLLEDVAEARGRVLGPLDPDTFESRIELARLEYDRGRYDESSGALEAALADLDRALGPDDPLTLEARDQLGLVRRKEARYDDARALLEDTLERRNAVLGEDHPDTLTTLNRLAGIHLLQRRFDEAEDMLRQALDERRRVLGTSHPETLVSENDLAYALQLQGELPEARELYEDALERGRRVLGDDHPHVLTILNNLGLIYRQQRDYAKAEEILVEAYDTAVRVRGGDHPDTLGAENSLAGLYYETGRYEEAEPLFRRSLEAYRAAMGDDHPNTVSLIDSLSWTYRALGRWEDAEPLARELVLRTPTDDPAYPGRERLLQEIRTHVPR